MTTPDLSRLFAPKTIAVIGGGAWCASIIGAAKLIGYKGEIIPFHPEGKVIAGLQSFKQLSDWPGKIDAAFVGVNRNATIEVIAELSALKAGGAVCFASGFAEAENEVEGGTNLQADLIAAAGDMPILGPNCYGFINALDQCAVWPDQHGCTPVDRGVAILTQSSNIAINLTMQRRALPIAYMVTCGNMAQTSQAQIAMSLLDDPRVTALGVHVEGFGDIQQWTELAAKAASKSIPIVAIKVGRSEQAQQATVSHTASLAGNDAGAQALLNRLGIARVNDIPTFLETLKLLHVTGPLASNRIASISCSGGEASLIADTALSHGIEFPALSKTQKQTLKGALGPKVALANPLDYHTYIWRDTHAMAQAWSAMAAPDTAITLSIVDYPTTDASDWECATQAAIEAHKSTARPFGVVSTLPELMPPDVAERLMKNGVVPLQGITESLSAVSAASKIKFPVLEPVLTSQIPPQTEVLTESDAKVSLAEYGVQVPLSGSIDQATRFQTPVVIKGVGLAHKSEHNAVRLNIAPADIEEVAAQMPTPDVLIEEMITESSAELLVGVTLDPAHGFVLTLGAGGVLTELLQDSVSILVPSSKDAVEQSLKGLKSYKLLEGYRGKRRANVDAIIDAIMSVQAYVVAHADTLAEVEINPLICTPTRAVAADALIRKAKI